MSTDQSPISWATGRRKTSVARVRVISGTGKTTVNGRPFETYFPTEDLQNHAMEAIRSVNLQKNFDIIVLAKGGGPNSQAGAVRHGITRALMVVDPTLRAALKKSGFVTRDPRMRERKKPGQPGARRRFQFSKR